MGRPHASYIIYSAEEISISFLSLFGWIYYVNQPVALKMVTVPIFIRTYCDAKPDTM